ncbi:MULTISPECIES: capsule biosynthesis protein [unclassified Paracoccus (in: a-proteobacteria)]|uniref:capsule biosynthesis protein n=1 Tax=unclassified Paracoccus (in: a-proteobacteria) TaxID=2688777 RepID=UPI0016026847|nr:MULTISPECIES: capsule biosynthesis protein [unclassified Paracoccus (in: a-proteobacteria)]MBB1490615.1 capsule biosynthesis protein [Paracoccus sp. MC1854]MBB1499293.1 capsule biosynthesis protein [Paracoccus sp. MC1862]QQO46046.1 capsule biosynthesis protein [Paracoccus sp. MC1862]
MTTPPKVRRFHLSPSESPIAAAREAARSAVRPDAAPRRAEAEPARTGVRVEVHKGGRPAGPAGPAADQGQPGAEMPFADTDDGFGSMRFPGADAATPPQAANAPAGPGAEADAAALAAIRAENLTSRQLRMAARIAAMHEIEVSSEYEAVLRLRQRGIDPFHRGAVGKILSDAGHEAQAAPSPLAPATVPGGRPQRSRSREIVPLPPPGEVGPPRRPELPSREALTEERRAAEIYRIQRDIARRRRKRLAFLMARLAFFVGLPTLIAGWYYFTQATPLYATHSQFLIQTADGGFGGESAGLLGASPMATNPDSVSVQSYLTSRGAMLRLDDDLGFTRAFQDPAVDALLRLPEDATSEQAYKLYDQSVKIGYDPTEGVINMEVIAPDPQLSEQFSLALIRYAEGQVDQMSARLRDDQMKGAAESYADAERKVQESQDRIQELQVQLGVLDPMAESGAVMGRISTLETQLAEKRLELGQLQSNPRPNQSRVQGVEGDISRIEQMIAETRAQLTENTGNRASLAAITGQLRIAESDLATRQQLLAAAATQMEAARVEANKQVRYLSLSVAPVPPDAATYPKALQNTIVAFLIFSGIYLMMSLTASILREQVSS